MNEYILTTQVSFQRVGDDAVLLHTESGDYYGLNDTGALIVEQLIAHGDAHRVIESVCAHYNVSSEQARTDFERLMSVLVSKGLVESISS